MMDPKSQVEGSESPERPSPRIPPIAARRHPAIARIRSSLSRKCGVLHADGSRGDVPIVLGISGGADSLALLIAILILKRTQCFAALRPHVVHIHHHLRDDADRDAHHVAEVAARFGVPFEQIDVDPRIEGGNISAAARRLRYAALTDAARRFGATLVAVAHHADDQFETILMRLCRGGGVAALTGMPPRRSLSRDPKHRIDLIRPLLDLRRQMCESLCSAAEVQWIDDPTNLDPSHARGRLRREVAPVLESLWPGAVKHAAATAREARAIGRGSRKFEKTVDALLASAQESQSEFIFLNRAALRSLDETAIVRILRRAIELDSPFRDERLPSGEVHIAVARERLEQIACSILDSERRPRDFEVPGGGCIHIESRQVEIRRSIAEERPTG